MSILFTAVGIFYIFDDFFISKSYREENKSSFLSVVQKDTAAKKTEPELIDAGYYNQSAASYEGKIINGVDGATFKVINFLYAKDAKNVYCLGERIPGVDTATFEVLAGANYVAKDAHSLFFRCERLVNIDYQSGQYLPIDLPSFEVINTLYKDKSFVYAVRNYSSYGAITKIEDADLRTLSFPWYPDNGYFRDKNFVYFTDKKITGADPATFKIFEPVFYYAKDNTHVFFRERLIIDADQGSFSVVTLGLGCHKGTALCGQKVYGVDKKNVYEDGNKVNGITPSELEEYNKQFIYQ